MLKIPKKFSSLKFVRPIEWTEIFDNWRKGEAWQEGWKKHWQERGFDSWDEWRKAYCSPFKPKTLKWYLYKITEPLKDVPNFFGVPSRSWIEKYYNGKQTKKLKDINAIDNPKVLSLKKNFPKKTMLTGLVYKDDIVLAEGMHRAVALACWDKSKSLNSKITIALALWGKEIPVVGHNYKK